MRIRNCSALTRTRWALAVVLGLLCATSTPAEVLNGKVTVSGTKPLAGALVRAREAGTGRTFATRINQTGTYTLPGLSGTKYLLEIENDGRNLYQGVVDLKGGEVTKDVNLVAKPTAEEIKP